MLTSAISSSVSAEGARTQPVQKTKNATLIALIERVKALSPQIERLKVEIQNHIQHILAEASNRLLAEKKFELWDQNSKNRWHKNGTIALVIYREFESFEKRGSNLLMQNKSIVSEFQNAMKENSKDPGVEEFLGVYEQNLEALEYKKFWGEAGKMMYSNLCQIKKYNESGCQIQ